MKYASTLRCPSWRDLVTNIVASQSMSSMSSCIGNEAIESYFRQLKRSP